MSNLLVLGGSYLQSNFIKTGVSLGHNVTVIDKDPFCYATMVNGATFQHIDLVDKESVASFAHEFCAHAVISPANEIGNITAAYVSKKIGLLYNSEEVVRSTIDKSCLKRKLLNSSIKVPESFKYEPGIENVLEFPVIVKPSNSSASRGISSVKDKADFANAIKFACKHTKEGEDVLIEELIYGDQYSIETLSSKGQHYIVGITQEMVTGPPNFLERSHFIGPKIHENYYLVFKEFINELLTLIGIQVGPSHIEVIVNDKGIYLVEVASRSGGWRDFLMGHAGIKNFNELIIQSYLGEKINENMLIPPKTNSMVGLLMYPEDLYSYLKAKSDSVLVGEFFNGKGPALEPTSLIDSFGYFYVTSENIYNYKLKQPTFV